MSNDITQIGAIVLIVQAAFKFGEMLVNKYTGNGSAGIRKNIEDLRENHIHELRGIMDKVDKRTEDMNGKLIQIVELLKLIEQRK